MVYKRDFFINVFREKRNLHLKNSKFVVVVVYREKWKKARDQDL